MEFLVLFSKLESPKTGLFVLEYEYSRSMGIGGGGGTQALQHGVKIMVDGFEFSKPVPYTYCNKGGCSASFQLDNKMIEMLKKGKKMEITAVGTNGKEFTLPVSLNGFTKAFSELTSE